MLEIERKFLLKAIPQRTDFRGDDLYIEQYYGQNSKEGQFRIRKQCLYKQDLFLGTYFITKKERVNSTLAFVYKEVEREISEEHFDELKNDCTKHISKKRLIYYDEGNKGLKWEVDVYPFSLIIAEIELPNEDYQLTIPDFIQEVLIGEVKENIFSNINLATKIK